MIEVTHIEEHPARTYTGPAALATRYTQLEGRAIEGCGRGFDVEASYLASFDAGGSVPDWTPLDHGGELATLRQVLRQARADMAMHHEHHERWWRCWWDVRVNGVRASSEPAGYSRQRVYEVLDHVDEYVEGSMAWHEVLDPRKIPPPRVRVAVNPHAFDEDANE